MKKLLLFLMVITLAVPAFSQLAIEPTIEAEAEVKFGIDLDTVNGVGITTGFETSAEFNIELVLREETTEEFGEGNVYGWIEVEDVEIILNNVNDGEDDNDGGDNPGNVEVSWGGINAELRLGPLVYVDIRGGELDADMASDFAIVNGNVISSTADIGIDEFTADGAGIGVGVNVLDDTLNIELSFASDTTPDGPATGLADLDTLLSNLAVAQLYQRALEPNAEAAITDAEDTLDAAETDLATAQDALAAAEIAFDADQNDTTLEDALTTARTNYLDARSAHDQAQAGLTAAETALEDAETAVAAAEADITAAEAAQDDDDYYVGLFVEYTGLSFMDISFIASVQGNWTTTVEGEEVRPYERFGLGLALEHDFAVGLGGDLRFQPNFGVDLALNNYGTLGHVLDLEVGAGLNLSWAARGVDESDEDLVFLSDDEEVTSSVGIGFTYAHTNLTDPSETFDVAGTPDDTSDDITVSAEEPKQSLALKLGFYEDSGDDGIVPLMGGAAIFELAIPDLDDTDTIHYGLGFYGSFDLGIFDPYVGVIYKDEGDAELQAKVGFSISEIIANTTLGIDWESGNLLTDGNASARNSSLFTADAGASSSSKLGRVYLTASVEF